MNEGSGEAPDPEYETIQPVAVDISQHNAGAIELSDRARFLPWMILIALLCVLAAVILVLPALIDEPVTERLIVDQLPATPNAQTPPRQPQISPWEQAQIEQAREAAKAALDSILETQFTLQELGVADWAGDQFDSALSLAREGDQAYRSQEFIGAEAAYLRSGEILNNLLASAASVYERELTRGSEALAAGTRSRRPMHIVSRFESARKTRPPRSVWNAQQCWTRYLPTRVLANRLCARKTSMRPLPCLSMP